MIKSCLIATGTVSGDGWFLLIVTVKLTTKGAHRHCTTYIGKCLLHAGSVGCPLESKARLNHRPLTKKSHDMNSSSSRDKEEKKINYHLPQ